MIFEWFDSAAAITTAAFVNGILIGALLAVAAWGGIRLLSTWRPLNATTRFYVWTTVFVMSAGLVLWQGERYMDEREAGVQEMSAPVDPLEAVAPLELVRPVRPVMEVPPSPAAPAVIEDVPGLIEAAIAPAVAKISLPDHVELSGLDPFWRIVLFTIWATITGMLLLRLVLGLRGVWLLKKNSYPAPARVQMSLQKLLKKIDSPRAIRVTISDEVQTAVAIGFLKPEILLPASMLGVLSSAELEQVLLHEAAHLQRRDDWTMLFQRIISALLFFHPGILLMSNLMDRDREFACDDWVIALTRRPKAYASCLAKLVAQHARTQPPIIVPGFSSSKEALFERVKTILDKKRTISFKLSRLTFAGVLLITVLLLVLMVKVVPVIALPDHQATPLPEETREPAREVVSLEEIPSTFSPGYGGDGAAALLAVPVATVPTTQPVAAPADTSSLSATSMSRLLLAARHIPSSTDRAQLLIEATGKMKFNTRGTFEAYLQTADSVPSSGDKARVLIALSETQQMDDASAVLFLKTVSAISSASDKSRVLVNSLSGNAISLDAEHVRDAYLQAVEHISSSTEYRRVMKAFLTKTK